MLAGNHWTSSDSGRSSAAVLSNQSQAGNEDPLGTTGSNRKNGLDQNSSHAMGYTKPFDPINVVSDLSIYSGEQDREKELHDLISPSNSSESDEHFGHSAENSTLIGSELYDSRKNELNGLQLPQAKPESSNINGDNHRLVEKCANYLKIIENLKKQQRQDGPKNGHFYSKEPEWENGKLDLHTHLSRLHRDMDNLKEENTSLEKKLMSYRNRPNQDPHFQHPAGFLESYEITISKLKTELSKIRKLLEKHEIDKQQMSEKWKLDATTKLTHLNGLLQERLESVDDGAASKRMILSLESRIKLVEDRLKQERTENSQKLSEVEEKLLVENASLKVSESQARRHLQRLSNELTSLKKRQQELNEVCRRMKCTLNENGLIETADGSETTNDYLSEVTNLHLVNGIQDGVTDLHLVNGRQDVEEQSDIIQQMQDMKNALQQQIRELVKEKHSIASDLQNLVDINDGLKSERDTWRKSLSEVGSSQTNDIMKLEKAQARVIESLKEEMEAMSADIQRSSSVNTNSSEVVKILQKVIETNEQLLHDALAHAESSHHQTSTGNLEERDHFNKNTVMKLYEEELLKSKSRPSNDNRAKIFLEMFRSRMNETNSGPSQPEELQKKLERLEELVDEKDGQIFQLKLECTNLTSFLEYEKKISSLQQETNTKLQHQMMQLQNQFREKSREVDFLSNAEADLQRELKTTKAWLDIVNKELLEKDAEVKTLELVRRSSLGNHLTQSTEEDNDLAMSEGKLDGLDQEEYDKKAVELDLLAANLAMENLIRENSEMRFLLQQLKRQLDVEREVVSQMTFDKMNIAQELTAVTDEKDAFENEKLHLENEIKTQKLEYSRLKLQLDSQLEASSNKFDNQSRKFNEKIKQLTSELQVVKHKLESREKDIAHLQEILTLLLKSDEAIR